jgi:hypothetical protein
MRLLRHATSHEHGSLSLTGALYEEWRSLMSGYSQRQLSHEDDVLPALSGLAAFFREQLQDQYLAGLWRQDLLPTLMWRISPSDMVERVSAIYRAPSWSWASVISPANWHPFELEGLDPALRVDNADCTVRGENPYGRVEVGYLEIHGPVMMFEINPQLVDGKIKYGLRHQHITCDLTADTDLESWDSGLQESLRTQAISRTRNPRLGSQLKSRGHVTALIMSRVLLKGQQCFFMLVLGRSPQDPQCYERIGIAANRLPEVAGVGIDPLLVDAPLQTLKIL